MEAAIFHVNFLKKRRTISSTIKVIFSRDHPDFNGPPRLLICHQSAVYRSTFRTMTIDKDESCLMCDSFVAGLDLVS